MEDIPVENNPKVTADLDLQEYRDAKNKKASAKKPEVGRPASLTPIKRRFRALLTAFYRQIAVIKEKIMLLVLRRQTEKFYMVMGGHIFFQTLNAAIQLDLFTLLSRHGYMTRSQIAYWLGIEDKPLRILLSGLMALGILKKKGESYGNTFLANTYLNRDRKGNVAPIIDWQHYINYKPMYHFHEAILANSNVGLEVMEGQEPTLYERLAHDKNLENIFQKAMEAISVQANPLLARYVDLSKVKHLVDVGGGNGTNIMALARKNPHLKASVFDSPTVCKIATENIAREGMSDRCDAIPGDCFENPFPKGADCILFGHFFTIWSEKRNLELLKKAYDALPQGGRVIIFNMMQRNDETGPISTAIGSPYFLTLATGEGMLYTWNEYKSWLKKAGFSSVKTHPLPRDHGAIIGVKSRQPTNHNPTVV